MNDACGGFKKYRAAVGAGALLLAAGGAGAGTVTVDRVVADTVLAKEIGYPPPRTEVLYYSFGEDAGTTVPNVAGPDYAGTKSGCVWTNAGRYAGGAMSFDGAGDYVNVGTGLKFPAWGQYSVSVWFLNNGGGSFSGYGQKIMDKTDDDFEQYWYMGVDANGAVGMKVGMIGPAPVALVDGSSNYIDNAWHHAVAVRDGTNGWLWVDGVLKASCTHMISYGIGTRLYVGYSYNPYSSSHKRCWSGLLDEVRVYDRVLRAEEIADLYAEGAVSLCEPAVSVTTNLVVRGDLTVTGGVSFTRGVYYSRPLGDLSCGIYTNAP